MGEDYVAVGDWNRTVGEGPMSTFIANGMVRYGDEPEVKKINKATPEHEVRERRWDEVGASSSNSSRKQGEIRLSRRPGKS